jgi:GDP-mannose 6-dehydrogenase
MVGCLEAVLNDAEIVTVGKSDPDFRNVPERLREDQVLVDFVRIVENRTNNGRYDGICWWYLSFP